MDANTFGLMSAGFANALMPSNLIMMIIGVTIGIVVGCMPGLSAAMGVALLLPLTFGMAPETGLIMLGGIYCGRHLRRFYFRHPDPYPRHTRFRGNGARRV